MNEFNTDFFLAPKIIYTHFVSAHEKKRKFLKEKGLQNMVLEPGAAWSSVVVTE